MGNECTAYQWLEGHNIGPKFPGRIAEEGRVIGFLTERVMDGDKDARHATPADLEACSRSSIDLGSCMVTSIGTTSSHQSGRYSDRLRQRTKE